MRLRIMFVCPLLMMITGPLRSQHTNIMISDLFNTNEPSIAINHKNTNEIVAGANIDNFYFSTDGGYNWQEYKLTSTWGVWGDPCLIADTSGRFFFFHLSNTPGGNFIDRIVCQRLDSLGGNWNNGTYMGLNGTQAQDKEWAVVDKANNNIYVTWTRFDNYGSANPADSSYIMFSRSTDQGQTWSPAIRINKVAGDCIDSDLTVEGAVPAVGPNGEIYVSWAGPAGLVFDRSTDAGNTWLANDIPVSPIPGGWDFIIPGIYRSNGFPVTCCDLSGGPYHGTIYINWSDQRNGIADTDIWLSRSTDGGNTWSSPIRVNDDPPGKHQFFNWMTVDQTNGYLYFVFYDRRNYTDSNTDVYMAVSKDGGLTFTNFKISDMPFVPNSGIFFGDYTNISAHNNIIRPIWTRLHNGQLSMWTAIIDTAIVGIETPIPIPATIEQNYPNPFNSLTSISFRLTKASVVSLSVHDPYGRVVTHILDNQRMEAGKYIETFDAEPHRLGSGVYHLLLKVDGKTIKKQMVLIR